MPTPWITTSDGAFALAGVPASARRQTTTATANRPFLTPLPKAIPWEKASVHPIGDPNPLFRFAPLAIPHERERSDPRLGGRIQPHGAGLRPRRHPEVRVARPRARRAPRPEARRDDPRH